MSNLRQSSGQDYPAASRKHCLDARILLDNQRSDGAAYLEPGMQPNVSSKQLSRLRKKIKESLKSTTWKN